MCIQSASGIDDIMNTADRVGITRRNRVIATGNAFLHSYTMDNGADHSSILDAIACGSEVDELLSQAIITCTVDGILEVEDLLIVSSDGDEASAAPRIPAVAKKAASVVNTVVEDDDPARIGKIREKWHNIARLLASGLDQRMVASLSGYTESYLSILINNPAFTEILKLYSNTSGAANTAKIITEQLRTLGLRSVEVLNDKLSSGDDISVLEAIAIAKLGLDRSGHGPSSTVTAVSEQHLIDHAELKRLEAAARADSSQYIVPVSRIRQDLIENNS